MSSLYSKLRELISPKKVIEKSSETKKPNEFKQPESIVIRDLLDQVQELMNTKFIRTREELGYESSPESNGKSSKKDANINKGYSSNPEAYSNRREPTIKSVVSPSLKSRRPSVHTRLDTDKIAQPMPETPFSAPDLSIAITDLSIKNKVGQASKGCSETEKAPIMPQDSRANLGKYTAKTLEEAEIKFTQNQR